MIFVHPVAVPRDAVSTRQQEAGETEAAGETGRPLQRGEQLRGAAEEGVRSEEGGQEETNAGQARETEGVQGEGRNQVEGIGSLYL